MIPLLAFTARNPDNNLLTGRVEQHDPKGGCHWRKEAARPQESASHFSIFEASGLGARSWPVEVGWVDTSGESDAFLVRPHRAWTMDAWDPTAEKLHGLKVETLRKEGLPVEHICACLNQKLRGIDVYSDAPDWDGFWLFQLYSAAGAKPSFELSNFGKLVRPLAAGNEEQLFARADEIAPRAHRAIPDARHLLTLYQLALDNDGT